MYILKSFINYKCICLLPNIRLIEMRAQKPVRLTLISPFGISGSSHCTTTVLELAVLVRTFLGGEPGSATKMGHRRPQLNRMQPKQTL